MSTPLPISNAEWQEIVALPEIQEAWGLDRNTTAEEFASIVYGVKFDFISGGPGYVGDLFLIQGDALTDVPPFVLIRRNGKLELIHFEPAALAA